VHTKLKRVLFIVHVKGFVFICVMYIVVCRQLSSGPTAVLGVTEGPVILKRGYCAGLEPGAQFSDFWEN
jgi:hypothetical protein